MNEALVYLSAAGFLLAVFPVYIFNYVYVNKVEGYASVNVCIYRFLRIFNANTVKNSVNRIQINGRDEKIDTSFIKKHLYKIFNSLCITKIVQLSDVGIQNDSNIYISFAQNAFSTAIYKFIEANGGRTKLKNYTVWNQEHSNIQYYMKFVGIVNLMVLSKITFMLIMEKFNEYKA